MQIMYDQQIAYETGSFEHKENQKLIADIAILLLGANGNITLIKPGNVKIKYDFNSGEVKLESQVGSVNNSFSDLEKLIVQPIKQAISKIAVFELLKRVAALGNDNITSIINQNHPNLDNHQENMHKLDDTLMAIHDCVDSYKKKSTLTTFAFFNEARHTESLKAIEALISNNVHNIEDVEKICPREDKQKNQPTLPV